MNIDFPLKDSLIYRRKAIDELSGETNYSDTLDGITDWRSDPSKQPTEEQIQAKLKELQADYDAKSYARSRQQKYPNTNDLIVALWEKVIEGRSESADALEVKRQQIKTEHPKSE